MFLGYGERKNMAGNSMHDMGQMRNAGTEYEATASAISLRLIGIPKYFRAAIEAFRESPRRLEYTNTVLSTPRIVAASLTLLAISVSGDSELTKRCNPLWWYTLSLGRPSFVCN